MNVVPAGTLVGVSPRASRSSCGAPSTPKVGEERRSAISVTGTVALRSTCERGCDPRAARSAAGRRRRRSAPPSRPPSATSTGTRIDPSASPAMARPSSTPKTRERSSVGAVRWRSVRPATSRRLRPAPAAARSTNAPIVVAQAASAQSESAQTASPASRGGASRGRPTRAAVAAIPSTPPAPKAAFR